MWVYGWLFISCRYKLTSSPFQKLVGQMFVKCLLTFCRPSTAYIYIYLMCDADLGPVISTYHTQNMDNEPRKFCMFQWVNIIDKGAVGPITVYSFKRECSSDIIVWGNCNVIITKLPVLSLKWYISKCNWNYALNKAASKWPRFCCIIFSEFLN